MDPARVSRTGDPASRRGAHSFAKGALLGLSCEILRRHDAACDDCRRDLRRTGCPDRGQRYPAARRHDCSPDRRTAARSLCSPQDGDDLSVGVIADAGAVRRPDGGPSSGPVRRAAGVCRTSPGARDRLYAQGNRERSTHVVDIRGTACAAPGRRRSPTDAGAKRSSHLQGAQARDLQYLQQRAGGAGGDAGHHAAREFRHRRRVRLRQVDIDTPAGLAGRARSRQHHARRNVAVEPVAGRSDQEAKRIPSCCRIRTMRCHPVPRLAG